MDGRHSYLSNATKKVAKKCEEPLTVIAVMVLLFVLLVAAPFTGLSLVTIVILNAVIATINLGLVLILHNTHRHDIRMLQAKLASLAASNDDRQAPSAAGTLTQSELVQIRELLAAQPGEHDDANRQANRDRRPSLF